MQVVSGQSPQLKHQERIVVQGGRQEVTDPGDVLAGIRVVRARTVGHEIALAVRQEMQAQPGESVFNRIGHLVHQQLRDQVCPRCNLANSLRPVGGADRFDCNGGPVDRFFVDAKVRVDRTTHSGRDGAFGQCVVEDASPTRVGASTSEAGRIGKLFQGRDKALAPPGAAELCHRYHSRTALRRSAISSLKVSLSSSVSQDSSVPTTSEESRFLSSIIASMRSSIVPMAKNLCTKTFLRWPIRKARSVAWSSTAGFHQRSKWKTWFAFVRFRPTPPARSERMNSDGSVSES